MELIIKISAISPVEAYEIVTKLGMQHDVLEAGLDGVNYVFDNSVLNKSIKYFLREDFDHE